jgi:hypothetical protein
MDPQQFQDLVATLERLFQDHNLFADDPAALEQALGGEGALDDVPREAYMQALDQVLSDNGVPEDIRAQVADQLVAQDDYSGEGLLNHLTIVINDNDVTTEIDQSLHIDGEVHGDVVQQNDSNVANAIGEGSIAGEYVEDNQVQTGDGQQVGGNSGVQNQGNNSGQQAGANAYADNVTTGDGNTVASDEASRVGQGQVSQDYATVDDSSQAFGEGDSHNEANDTSDSHYTESHTASAADSFNYTDTDTDTQTQSIETHDGYGEHEYEPTFEHDDYKGDHDYGHDEDHHDHYDVDDHGPDFDQHAEIIDAN